MRAGKAELVLMAGLLLAAVVLGACSRERSLSCGEDADYLAAGTASALRIPDDLSVPDESESLRIPGPVPQLGDSEDEEQAARQACLQQSPAYSGD